MNPFGKNPKTNAFGIGSILTAVIALYQCYSGGHFDVMCAITILQGLFLGGGLLNAKDNNVTNAPNPIPAIKTE